MTPLVSMFTGNPGSKSCRPITFVPSIFVPSILEAGPKLVRAHNIPLYLLIHGHGVCTATKTDT